MGFHRLLPAIAVVATTICLSGVAHAQSSNPVASPESTAVYIGRVCAAIWGTQDKASLDDMMRDFNAQAIDGADAAKQEYETLRRLYKQASEEADVASAKYAGSIFSEAVADNVVKDDGLISKAQVASIAAGIKGKKSDEKGKIAEAKRDLIKTTMIAARSRLFSAYALGIATKDCGKDQTQYLEKIANPPAAPSPQNQQQAAAPPAKEGPAIQTVRVTLKGGWSGKCQHQGEVLPLSGRFTLQLNGDGTVGAGFADGKPAGIRGTVSSDGAVNGGGRSAIGAGEFVMTLSGRVGYTANGGLSGSGPFTASHPSGVRCDGQWSGS